MFIYPIINILHKILFFFKIWTKATTISECMKMRPETLLRYTTYKLLKSEFLKRDVGIKNTHSSNSIISKPERDSLCNFVYTIVAQLISQSCTWITDIHSTRNRSQTAPNWNINAQLPIIGCFRGLNLLQKLVTIRVESQFRFVCGWRPEQAHLTSPLCTYECVTFLGTYTFNSHTKYRWCE